MKRWTLRIRNVHGQIQHEERFWLRRNAEKVGILYTTPLPMISAAMTTVGYDGPPILSYEVTR